MEILRERRPTEHEADRNQEMEIEIGANPRGSSSGDKYFEDRRSGVIGMVSPFESDSDPDRAAADKISDAMMQALSSPDFNVDQPEASMLEALDAAQAAVTESGHGESSYQAGADVSAVKVFRDSNGTLLAALLNTGRQHIYIVKDGEPERLLDTSITSQKREDLAGVSVPANGDTAQQPKVIKLDDGDRIVIRSVHAIGKKDEDKIDESSLNSALTEYKPQKAAKVLSNETGAAVVLDVLSVNSGIGWLTTITRNRNRHDAETPNDSKGRLQRSIGKLGVGAALGYYLLRRRGSSRRKYQDDEPVEVESASTASSVVEGESDPDRGSRRWVGGRRLEVEDERERRRRGGAKRALLLGALAVGSVLALRYGVDLGDDISNWIGDRPDTGIDAWPFGEGDNDDGNRSGWDFNPSNENLDRNDDPVNESFRDTGGFDLLPPFFDGDWFSMNEGLNIDFPNADGEPNIDFDKDGDVDAPDVSSGTPELLLDAPEGSAPEVETPVAEPVTPPAPTVPPAWTPDMFNVENGSGMIREIHQIGHEIVGNNFTTADAVQVYEAVVSEYGSAALELPQHSGADLYQHGNELRISAPGQAHWATQEIENFVYEKMREAAA